MAQRRARAPWYVGSRTEIPVETWEFDTIADCTLAGVPININNIYAGMVVDWGDGSVTTVTSDMTVSEAYTHEYAEAGQYHITVSYNDWASVSLSPSNIYATSPITEARASITKVYKIPRVANTNFQYLFASYTALTELEDGLFDSNPQVVYFTRTFDGCSNLIAIPDGLFDNCPLVTYFECTFRGCTSLTAIPSGLFDNNTQVSAFERTFSDCSNIIAIPDGLFDNNTAAQSFLGVFEYCSSITVIPDGLFDNNTAATTFQHAFLSCSNISAIPEGLFDNNILVTNFTMTFSGCYSIAAIPEGLFDNNTLVTTFANTFSSCQSITEIPDGLFDNCPLVTSFYGTFNGCYSLTTIPEGLFDNNTAATDFSHTFYATAIAPNKQCASGEQYFSLNITSEVVTIFGTAYANQAFWSPARASVDAVYLNVPEGSTTETAALSYNDIQPSAQLTLNTDPCSS